MDTQKALKAHVLEVLDARSAHISTEDALDGFPLKEINTRVPNSPHTAWELLEHIRIAQWDILEFSRNAKHVSPDWPEGYWPAGDGTTSDWIRSVKQVLGDLRQMRDLVKDESTDLFARIPHGDGQTILREALLDADHNAYHIGQLMLVRRMLEAAITSRSTKP